MTKVIRSKRPAKMSRADYIKCAVVCYLRYVRQFPVVSIETKALLTNSGRSDRADVLALDKDHALTEVEVKSSIIDLKNDADKRIHKDFKTPGRNPSPYPVHYFYFAIHEDMKDKALAHITAEHPYAGILLVGDAKMFINIREPVVKLIREPRRMLKPPLTKLQFIYMLRSMSSTICRQMYNGNFPKFPLNKKGTKAEEEEID